MILVATREQIKKYVCPACDGQGNPKKSDRHRPRWSTGLGPDPPDRGDLDYRRCGWCYGKGVISDARYNQARFLVAQRMLVEPEGEP